MIINFIIAFYFVFNVYCQPNYNSPYTLFGLGDLTYSSHSQGKSMGYTSISLFSKRYINSDNPSSTFLIDTLSFIVDFSTLTTYISQKSTTQKANFLNVNFDFFGFGFPITKIFKASLGITPFSNIGYNIKEEKYIDTIFSINRYSGDGNLSKFFFNLSLKLYEFNKKNYSQSFIVGIQPWLLFGNTIDQTNVSFPNSKPSYSLNIRNKRNFLGFNARTSFTYLISFFNKYKSCFFTVLLEPKTNIHYNNYNIFLKQITVLGNLFSDTINEESIAKNKLFYPGLLGFGFSYFSKNQFIFTAEYKFQRWSKSIINDVKLDNFEFVGMGIEYTPSPDKYVNYLSSINYRIGLFYSRTYYNINSYQIKEVGITLGFGLPLIKAVKGEPTSIRLKPPPIINVFFSFSKRGTTSYSLIKENFINFGVNFNLYDIWFLKRKYD